MVNPTVNNRKNIVRHSDFSRGEEVLFRAADLQNKSTLSPRGSPEKISNKQICHILWR